MNTPHCDLISSFTVSGDRNVHPPLEDFEPRLADDDAFAAANLASLCGFVVKIECRGAGELMSEANVDPVHGNSR